jgi:MFS family permease
MPTLSQAAPRIFWTQVASLIALDLAVIISWMAYHEYQPGLVELFGFTPFMFQLAVLQGIILFVTPPIAGMLADRLRQRRGVRLPVVNLGVNFVAMVFMAVAFTVFMKPSGWILNAFPVMIALWLIAMNIFHSPAISTVELFVPPQKLPQVMAIFAVTADLCQAIEPSVVDIIEALTAPVTFAAGGILVFATGWWFMRTVKKFETDRREEGAEPKEAGPLKSNFALVVVMGIVMGAALSIFFTLFPQWATVKLSMLQDNGISGNAFISILAVVAAAMAIVFGNLAERIGPLKFVLAGAALCAIFATGAFYGSAWISLICFIGYAISVSLISVSALPIALVNLSPTQKVFGVGLFFSGVQLMDSVLLVYAVS